MKKWKSLIALILMMTTFLSVGCISALEHESRATDIPSESSGYWQPSGGWAPNNPAPSNSDFNFAPSNSNQYYDEEEDEVSYTIYATAHKGGSISPKGAVDVWEGDDQAFEITPKSKYKIEKVLVDGKDKGALDFYEFENVTRDHTIEVYFVTIAEAETATTDTEFNPNTGAI